MPHLSAGTGNAATAASHPDRNVLPAVPLHEPRDRHALALWAHDVRGHLTVMRHAITLMRRTSEVARWNALSITLERQLQWILKMVDELGADGAESASGHTPLRQRVELGALLYDVADICRVAFESRQQRFLIDMPSAPVDVKGQPVALMQAFSNLLRNAGHYTPRGGTVWLTLRRDRLDAVVTVRDNGHGLSADELPRLFGLHERGRAGRRLARDGQGLGLYAVRRCVSAHGGVVTALSDGADQGTTVSVRLPLML